MCSIQGSDHGRIILGKKDGIIEKIACQIRDSWVGRRGRRENYSSSYFSIPIPSFVRLYFSDDVILHFVVDNSTYSLYPRFEKRSVQVYVLGNNENRSVN